MKNKEGNGSNSKRCYRVIGIVRAKQEIYVVYNESTKKINVATAREVKELVAVGRFINVEVSKTYPYGLLFTECSKSRIQEYDKNLNPIGNKGLTILRRLVSDSGNIRGYIVLNQVGTEIKLNRPQAIQACKYLGVSNAKIVLKNGKYFLSGIKSEIPNIVVENIKKEEVCMLRQTILTQKEKEERFAREAEKVKREEESKMEEAVDREEEEEFENERRRNNRYTRHYEKIEERLDNIIDLNRCNDVSPRGRYSLPSVKDVKIYIGELPKEYVKYALMMKEIMDKNVYEYSLSKGMNALYVALGTREFIRMETGYTINDREDIMYKIYKNILHSSPEEWNTRMLYLRLLRDVDSNQDYVRQSELRDLLYYKNEMTQEILGRYNYSNSLKCKGRVTKKIDMKCFESPIDTDFNSEVFYNEMGYTKEEYEEGSLYRTKLGTDVKLRFTGNYLPPNIGDLELRSFGEFSLCAVIYAMALNNGWYPMNDELNIDEEYLTQLTLHEAERKIERFKTRLIIHSIGYKKCNYEYSIPSLVKANNKPYNSKRTIDIHGAQVYIPIKEIENYQIRINLKLLRVMGNEVAYNKMYDWLMNIFSNSNCDWLGSTELSQSEKEYIPSLETKIYLQTAGTHIVVTEPLFNGESKVVRIYHRGVRSPFISNKKRILMASESEIREKLITANTLGYNRRGEALGLNLMLKNVK